MPRCKTKVAMEVRAAVVMTRDYKNISHMICPTYVRCYSCSLAPNIMDLYYSFSFLSYLLSWLIRSPLVSWQLHCLHVQLLFHIHVVHAYSIHLMQCISMLLIYYNICHMLSSPLSLGLCPSLPFLSCAWCTPPMHVSLPFHSATAMWLHHVHLPFHDYARCMPLIHTCYLDT